MSTFIPVFTSPAGEAEFMQAYQAILEKWPVPYQELTVPSRWGETHIIASGPEDAPPVVLLHALFAAAKLSLGKRPTIAVVAGMREIKSNPRIVNQSMVESALVIWRNMRGWTTQWLAME